MTYVIAEPCIDVLDQACVDVCPVDCIHFDEGKDRKLYIDPDECIDCGACEPECPVEAIFAEEDVPTSGRNILRLRRCGLATKMRLEQRSTPYDLNKWLRANGNQMGAPTVALCRIVVCSALVQRHRYGVHRPGGIPERARAEKRTPMSRAQHLVATP